MRDANIFDPWAFDDSSRGRNFKKSDDFGNVFQTAVAHASGYLFYKFTKIYQNIYPPGVILGAESENRNEKWVT